MTTISIAEDQALQEQIVDAARDDLARLFAELDLSDGVAAREALISILEDLTEVYGESYAVAALEMFERIREAAGQVTKTSAVLAPPVPPSQIKGSVKWAVDTLFGDKYNEVMTLSKLQDITTRLVLQQGRDTIALNVSKDRSAKYARVLGPSESNCKYCLMLASRGAVYHSSESAKAGYHDGCRCTAVPMYDGMSIEDYDPKALHEEYLKLG